MLLIVVAKVFRISSNLRLLPFLLNEAQIQEGTLMIRQFEIHEGEFVLEGWEGPVDASLT